jgi:large subunit ribosomal protein L24
MARHVRKGDRVMVIAGDDRGRVGEVLSVDRAAGRCVVQGVHRVYRHLRPSRQHPQGGRIQKEMPVDLSNVLPVDPRTNRPTRVGFRRRADGTKERYAKRSGESLGVVGKTAEQV